MYKAFIDESGLKGDPVCVVGGYYGAEKVCDDAADEWLDTLQVFGVQEFHADEFWQRDNGQFTGQYRHLHRCEARDLLIRLIALTESLTPISMAIIAKLFNELTEDERRYFTTSYGYSRDWPRQGAPSEPYMAAFQYAVIGPLSDVPEGEKISYTFDRQDKLADKAREVYDGILELPLQFLSRLSETISFGCGEETILLQAADLLAYTARRYTQHGQQGDDLLKMAMDKLLDFETVKVLNYKGMDLLLQACPFRAHFWDSPGFAEPDLIEQARMRGFNVPAAKYQGKYYAPYVKRSRLKTLAEVDAQPLGSTLRQQNDVSTKNKRSSTE